MEAVTNGAFAQWLRDQVTGSDRVAAPDGEREAYEFGAVNPWPGAVTVPWDEFEDRPEWAVSRLFFKRRTEISPAVLVEVDRVSGEVSLRLGRHVAAERALPGAVLLG